MSQEVLSHEIRRGRYADSIVLMQLQSALAALPGVLDAGVVMATEANLDLLRAGDLLPAGDLGAASDDLLLVVRAESEDAATAALRRVDELLERRGDAAESEFRPRSLRGALKQLPGAGWVLVSVPGRYAARVADHALDHGRSVFLYSDNVSLEEEVALKTKAQSEGLLVMGPDCGTAVIDSVGLGFANRVRSGPVGLVAASGTGLQAIAARVHAGGSGVSQAIGTGGRDLHRDVGAVTTLQGLDLLAGDEETRVIVLVSKPPEPAIAARVLARARSIPKPVVVAFQGFSIPLGRLDNLHFAHGLSHAAELAVGLTTGSAGTPGGDVGAAASAGGLLRGLFSGGTLALECLAAVAPFLEPIESNLKLPGVTPVSDPTASRGHAVLDLGADEYTVGRLHPMIDPDLRLRRLAQEAADPEVGLILLDVVLGEGSHPDPAGSLAPAIEAALNREAGRELGIVCLVVGTDQDPQNLEEQIARLEAAGASVETDVEPALVNVLGRLGVEDGAERPVPQPFRRPFAAVNFGLESFYDSLVTQEADAVHVDWRPPAGGNERLTALLDRMYSTADRTG